MDRCYSTATQQFLTVKSFLSNQIVAKLGQRKMQPREKVSSIPDANTVFWGATDKDRERKTEQAARER
jgi:hypothetical protein